MNSVPNGIGLKRLEHVVLWVSNVDRSVRFYVDVLGFEVSRQRPGAAFLRIPGTVEDHDLGLFEQPGVTPPDERSARMYHMAWEVAEVADLARAQERLAAAGSLIGASNHGSTLSLYAKDPDGIEFEVCWTVPGGKSGSRSALDIEAALAKWGTPSR